MRNNGGARRPDEILAEIDRTRGEMDRTLSAIEHRLTPGQLVDQGVDYLRHSGANEFVQNLGGAAKQNPLPVALATIGIGWLMALGRQPAQHEGSGMHQSASSMKDRASDAMSSVADTTRQQYQRARGTIDYLVNEQPLVLGAIGLAIGAALGAAAPRTRKEEELMGEASRNLAEKAKEMGSQQVEKAKEAVAQATQSKPPLTPTQAQQPRAQQTPTTPEKKGGW